MPQKSTDQNLGHFIHYTKPLLHKYCKIYQKDLVYQYVMGMCNTITSTKGQKKKDVSSKKHWKLEEFSTIKVKIEFQKHRLTYYQVKIPSLARQFQISSALELFPRDNKGDALSFTNLAS